MPIEIHHSACPHDCPSTCALEVEKLDDFTIGRIRGARDNSYTAGTICAKVARYAERSGRDVSDFLFHRVLAMFKLGVIFMQIYAQYRRGTSSDERFKRFGDLARHVIFVMLGEDFHRFERAALHMTLRHHALPFAE